MERVPVGVSNWLKSLGLKPEEIANVLSLGTFVATTLYLLVTVVIAWVAIRQLRHLVRASRADYFLRLTREFFTDEVRQIIQLCASNCLRYVPAAKTKDSYFLVDYERVAATSKEETLTKRLVEKPVYSSFEIDDEVMGPLDDIRRLQEEGVLDAQTVDEVFGYYFLAVWENPEIQKYVGAMESEHPEYTKIPIFMKKLKERQPRQASIV